MAQLTRKLFPCLLGGTLLASCAPSSETDKARRVADAFLQNHLGPADRQGAVQSDGANWLVTYKGPSGHAGGDLKVWVAKGKMTVERFAGEQ